ncbi:MAG: ATP synthase F1 subunit delta [Saprospiraceae bacterium]
MSELSVARRYAKSLLDLAIDEKKLDSVIDDSKTLAAALESRELFLLLKSPIIKGDKKLKALSTIFSGKIDDLTMRFIGLTMKKGRESILPEIIDSLQDQYNKMRNITTATLTTAVNIDSAVINDIETKLKSEGGHVDLSTKIDSSIIGGYILEIGDKIYDASVQRQIKDLRKELTNG